MSMNGVDYTKQLAKDREYFQEANRKLRESSEKRIEDTNKLAEHVTTKQRENFIEDRADLEKNYQENLNHLKEKSMASMNNSSSKFNQEMEKERENFTQESLKKSKDFDQRLNDIKSSYEKAFVSEKDRHESLEETQKKKYQTNLNEYRSDADEKMGKFQDKLSSTGNELKDQYNRERQQLVRAQEDRLTDSYKDAANKRAELKDHISYVNKQKDIAQKAEMEQQRTYTQDKMESFQKKFQDRYEALTKDYSQRNENLAESQQKGAVQINRQHQDKLAEVQRGYNDSLRKIELDKRRMDNGSGDFAEFADKQQGLKEKVVQENKIKRLNDEIVDVSRKYEVQASKDRKIASESMKEQSIEATALRDRQLNEANADKLVTVSKEREKAEKQIQNREHQNRLEKTSYETQLMNERNSANDRIAKLKKNFHESMETLGEKHQAALEDVTKTSNDDKQDFMKRIQKQRSDEVFEMKRSFGKLMDATVQDYEQRLASFQRDNDYMKLTLNQKIQNITDQADKQLESQTKLFEERRAADVKGQQLLMDQRERQLKKNFSEMNLSYQKKIDKMQVENDTKFKLMTNDYETKLKELKASTSKEMAQKDIKHQIELDRIKQTYEDEKLRVVNAFESQIEAIKKGHEEQMRQMTEYKKLS